MSLIFLPQTRFLPSTPLFRLLFCSVPVVLTFYFLSIFLYIDVHTNGSLTIPDLALLGYDIIQCGDNGTNVDCLAYL